MRAHTCCLVSVFGAMRVQEMLAQARRFLLQFRHTVGANGLHKIGGTLINKLIFPSSRPGVWFESPGCSR
jgi:hypothetical protein